MDREAYDPGVRRQLSEGTDMSTSSERSDDLDDTTPHDPQGQEEGALAARKPDLTMESLEAYLAEAADRRKRQRDPKTGRFVGGEPKLS